VKTLELSRGGKEHKGSVEAMTALAALSLKTLQGKATSREEWLDSVTDSKLAKHLA